MNTGISNIIKKNIDYVRDNSHINLDFVYLQINNITNIIGNEEFMVELKDTINQILDRDDNDIFDSDDIKLLRDIFMEKDNQVMNIYNFIIEFFNSVMSLIAKYKSSVLKLDKESIEGIFFGVLSYTLFQYGTMRPEDKKFVLDIVVAIYTTLETVNQTLDITKKIMLFLKNRGWCKFCIKTNTTDTNVNLDREILRSRDRVKELSKNIKNNQKLQMKVTELENKLNNDQVSI